MITENFEFRNYLKTDDIKKIEKTLSSTDAFYNHEINVALELVECNLNQGTDKSGYHFILAESDDKLIGYICFGLNPCTKSSYDVYWIVVDKEFQGMGMGKKLLSACESIIRELGGKKIYIETSMKDSYISQRKFYENCKYIIQAVLNDFYDDNDDKAIYCRVL